eukprot:TRINITY_DN5164_c0_g2_i1.p1 TRINITY_DN5164_c0_g2~~TRINITY_DN5164_c0_g2_i1.p1  ORF type:complete len:623 (-),score=160.51 TRINITY_DN5164_c0_g2_i1:3-1871(-)
MSSCDCGAVAAGISVPLSVLLIATIITSFIIIRKKNKIIEGVSPECKTEKIKCASECEIKKIKSENMNDVIQEELSFSQKKVQDSPAERPKSVADKIQSDVVNTPEVHVIRKLREFRNSERLGKEDLEDLDTIIGIIATRSLYNYNAANLRKLKVIDRDTSKFLIEYVTNVKGQQGAATITPMNSSDKISPIGSATRSQRQSKGDLRKAAAEGCEKMRKKQLENTEPLINHLPQKVKTKDSLRGMAPKKGTIDAIARKEESRRISSGLNEDALSDIDLSEHDSKQRAQPEFFPDKEPSKYLLSFQKLYHEATKENLFSSIDSWDFDAFSFSERSKGHGLELLVFELFNRYDLFNAFPLNEEKLFIFFKKIEQGYFKNPYHNSTHAIDVLQVTHFMLTKNDKFFNSLLPVEKLAIVVSAACHDFNHPGINNAFLVNVEDPLAIQYNDQSVLESTHSARVFGLLHEEENDFLENMELTHYRTLRNMIIQLILATDMSKHADILSDLKARVAAEEFKWDNAQVRLLTLKMMIKAADISNPARSWNLCEKWAGLVMEEFFEQGDMEKERELTVSAMMDRTTTKISKVQAGFSEFVVKPLMDALSQAIGMGTMLINLNSNVVRWKEL